MSTVALTNIEKKRKLRWALTGDACNVVYFYLAFAGPIFLLFLDKLGLEKEQIGLILSAFPFCGLLALLSGPVSARLGFKRVFLVFWLLRKIILVAMIAAPWVLQRYGDEAVFAFVAGVIVLFAISRSIAESALSMWSSEYIPGTIRGRFTAIQSVVTQAVAAAASFAVSKWIGPDADLPRFQLLFAVAFFFGVANVALYSRVPGGAPLPARASGGGAWRETFAPLRDAAFRRFLIAGIVMTLGWTPMASFVPLYLKEQIGLEPGQIILLDTTVMIGSLLSSLFWGWATDRYGGKPVMVFNLAALALHPLAFLLLPRHSDLSHTLAMVQYFIIGLVLPGWSIGYFRYLFVKLIPEERKTSYVAMHTAVIGVVSGVCPIAAGFFLDRMQNLGASLGPLTLDPYSPLYLNCIVLVIVSTFIMARVPQDSTTGVRSFAAMLVQGSPVSAIQALLAYQFAGYESKRIETIEKLGQARSPLSVEELVSALADPSFNVRYEAIISIARTRSDPKLVSAVVEVLHHGEPDLRTTAAWALGRMQATDAIPELRQELASEYPLLRARVARALGTLGDVESSNRLLTLFRGEPDAGLKVAYAAALGALNRKDTLGELLAFLRTCKDRVSRMETSLAIASLLGRDAAAQRLWRRMLEKSGDTLGGVLLGVKRRLGQRALVEGDVQQFQHLVEEAALLFSGEDHAGAIAQLRQARLMLKPAALTDVAWQTLDDALAVLEHTGTERVEYLCLVVHALHVGVNPSSVSEG